MSDSHERLVIIIDIESTSIITNFMLTFMVPISRQNKYYSYTVSAKFNYSKITDQSNYIVRVCS